MRVKQFLVLPKLPERVAVLQELAHNLWYSWNWDLVKLFIRLDPEIWEDTYQNPVEMLARLPQRRLEEAAEDEGFLASLDRVYEKYRAYMERKKWFHFHHQDREGRRVAYFSLEYGLDTGLPVYSGGLGVLSGDTLKAASDLGIPMVAVGLLYRYGYFRQLLTTDGWQQERYEENDWYHMPVNLVKDENDAALRISVNIEGVPVQLQIWQVKVGLIPLYLLDSNIPENATKFRDITSVLYGGDKEMRIRQEIVLGIGGVRALKAMGHKPDLYHMNEGHAWFLTLERLRNLMETKGLGFSDAMEYIWSTSVFTTHTPVPAGNERFEQTLLHRYLGDYVSKLGMSWKEFLNLGRVIADNESELFCMTVAALRTSAFANAVSVLHSKVSRQMWHNIWPDLPSGEVPIKAITNGVHLGSWISHDMNELFESYFGAGYVEKSGAPDVWKKVYNIPDAELWRIHNRRRERLVFFARKRLKQQLMRRGASQIEIHRADQILDPQTLTIGFARRFSTYKRGNLIFSDPERLARIVNDDKRPVQLILSGKAHPLDTPGKEIIRQVFGFISEERFHDRVFFLEDYDINVARYLVQGADVWMNNPRRPQEASGTSGMKAAINGALHFSILDGWWDEGYQDATGFKIGNGEEYDNVEIQDRLEAEALYSALEREVAPLFYNVSEIGLPAEWIAKMKASIQMAGEQFSAQRMLMDYSNQTYIPAMESGARLSANNFELAQGVAAWDKRMVHNWDKIAIHDIEVPHPTGKLYVGQELPITIKVFLGEISPDDVSIELVSGRLNSLDQIQKYKPITASLSGDNGSGDGIYVFNGQVILAESGRFGVTARIVPKNENLPHTIKPKLISWW